MLIVIEVNKSNKLEHFLKTETLNLICQGVKRETHDSQSFFSYLSPENENEKAKPSGSFFFSGAGDAA